MSLEVLGEIAVLVKNYITFSSICSGCFLLFNVLTIETLKAALSFQ